MIFDYSLEAGTQQKETLKISPLHNKKKILISLPQPHNI